MSNEATKKYSLAPRLGGGWCLRRVGNVRAYRCFYGYRAKVKGIGFAVAYAYARNSRLMVHRDDGTVEHVFDFTQAKEGK